MQRLLPNYLVYIYNRCGRLRGGLRRRHHRRQRLPFTCHSLESFFKLLCIRADVNDNKGDNCSIDERQVKPKKSCNEAVHEDKREGTRDEIQKSLGIPNGTV